MLLEIHQWTNVNCSLKPKPHSVTDPSSPSVPGSSLLYCVTLRPDISSSSCTQVSLLFPLLLDSWVCQTQLITNCLKTTYPPFPHFSGNLKWKILWAELPLTGLRASPTEGHSGAGCYIPSFIFTRPSPKLSLSKFSPSFRDSRL